MRRNDTDGPHTPTAAVRMVAGRVAPVKPLAALLKRCAAPVTPLDHTTSATSTPFAGRFINHSAKAARSSHTGSASVHAPQAQAGAPAHAGTHAHATRAPTRHAQAGTGTHPRGTLTRAHRRAHRRTREHAHTRTRRRITRGRTGARAGASIGVTPAHFRSKFWSCLPRSLTSKLLVLCTPALTGATDLSLPRTERSLVLIA